MKNPKLQRSSTMAWTTTPNPNTPTPRPRQQPKPQRSFCRTPKPNIINGHAHSSPNKIHTKPQ